MVKTHPITLPHAASNKQTLSIPTNTQSPTCRIRLASQGTPWMRVEFLGICNKSTPKAGASGAAAQSNILATSEACCQQTPSQGWALPYHVTTAFRESKGPYVI
jgi:hypothetical protein